MGNKHTSQPLPNGSVANQGLSKSAYAAQKRDLMQLINQLRSTGAAVDVDLPTIVVAGNQSSGKSSLIEAISAVSLPRDSGTCTRVPTEVRLRQETEGLWQCVVKIRQETDIADSNGASKAERVFGDTLTRPDQVDRRVRQAQWRILHPSAPQSDQDILSCVDLSQRPFSGYTGLEFSKDVVVLEISGPEVTDLTLVDLPGIIQHSQDATYVALIEDMVKTYIAKDCLILLVITMKDDYDNQKVVALAREADQTGERTIGVLTKADTPEGSEADVWVEVLKNHQDKTRLTHGYFATRQPKQDELNASISFETAREKETAFFETASPWASLSPVLRRRLGTKCLTAFLSDQLLSAIRERLPGRQAEIKSRTEKVNQTREDLNALGEPPTEDASRQMWSMVQQFSETLHKYAEGDSDYEQFLQGVNEKYERFTAKIRATAPRFVPMTRAESLKAIKLDEAAQRHLWEGQAKVMAPLDIDDLQENTASPDEDLVWPSRGRKLPNEIPPKVKSKIVKKCMSSWEHLAEDLLNEVTPLLRALVDGMIRNTFSKYSKGMLKQKIENIVHEQLRIMTETTRKQIQKIIGFEDRMFTMNTHYLEDAGAKILAELRDRRRGPAPEQSKGDKAESGHAGRDEATVTKSDDTDEYERELKVMAEVKAYWQVAYKRFIDYIPRLIDAELIIPASQHLNNALVDDLHILDEGGQQRCKQYLAESPEVASLREELERKRARLQMAVETLNGFYHI